MPGLLLLLLAGCSEQQSALAPAGTQASRLADLFWGMVVGGVVIWLVVIALAIHGTYFARTPFSQSGGRRFVIVGGVGLPLVVLTGLLSFSLAMLPDFLARAPEGALRIHVTGHQWWWRVQYVGPNGEPITLANEFHLPVGKPVEFHLESSDVIHAFWIPSLGGKVDMIPGRRTRLVLKPTEIGVYRGICAEYCGTSHALMSFFVVVEPEADFERWLSQQAASASVPSEPTAVKGAELFIASGCGACHAVRGTVADGVIGPDLTHVGSRKSIGAGVLTTDANAFLRWVAHTNDVKPAVHMPSFGMLPAEDLHAIGLYLKGLQ